MLQRGIDGFLVATLECLVNECVQRMFPCAFFKTAACLRHALRDRNEPLAVSGQFVGRTFGNAAHDGP